MATSTTKIMYKMTITLSTTIIISNDYDDYVYYYDTKIIIS